MVCRHYTEVRRFVANVESLSLQFHPPSHPIPFRVLNRRRDTSRPA
jgi:hypothetical protein